jgi:tight adherence protein B
MISAGLAALLAFIAIGALVVAVAVLVDVRRRRKGLLAGLRPDRSVTSTEVASLLRDPSEATWAGPADLLVRLEKRLRAADLDWSIRKALVLSAALGCAGLIVGLLFASEFRTASAVLLAALGAGAPSFYINHAATARARKIEEQLPEALDFLARAMRAGHAFSVTLELIADEIPEPMAGEFRKLYNEQNLGAPIDVALQGMADRCALLDVQFFVSAVLLQKETGGNLTVILTRLSELIRDRLRLKGQVRAASAHGRVTGMVLTAMPIVLMIGLTILSPNYLRGLITDPDGRYLIMGAVGGQLLGYLCIRQITNIRV